jgi:hypothetical protein
MMKKHVFDGDKMVQSCGMMSHSLDDSLFLKIEGQTEVSRN